MSTSEHPIALNSEQHRAFAEKVIWQTVGIVNCVRNLTASQTASTYSEGIGTGSACRWKDRELVLTANHVLEGAGPSELRFFLRLSGQIDWNTHSGNPALSDRTALDIDKILRCPQHDLAAIVLKHSDAGRVSLEYCEIPSGFAEVPPAGGGVFLAGYPSDQALPIESAKSTDGTVHRALAVIGNGHWGSIVSEPPRYFPSSYDSNLHFLISFDPSEAGSKPHGYSGTGVWYQGSAKSELWAARPVLAGVQIRWHRESNLMIAVRSEVVHRFFDEMIS